MARAQSKLDGLTAAFEQAAAEGGGWGDAEDAAYDDEYDDAFDGLGFRCVWQRGSVAACSVAVWVHGCVGACAWL